LEQKRTHRAKTVEWLTAICALLLVSVCAPCPALAEATPASKTVSPKPKGKTTSPKKSAAKKSALKKSAATRAKSSTSATTLKSTATARGAKSDHTSSRKKKKTARGQQKIDSERAQAIQEALIREHYLSGAAAGTWNQASEDAMRRYQADHGWQSKTVPDSRALISLGLGPSNDHLLNPESAMTTGPSAPRAASLNPVSNSADPGAHGNTSPTPLAEPGPAATSETSRPQ
jgi:hypothetical protein